MAGLFALPPWQFASAHFHVPVPDIIGQMSVLHFTPHVDPPSGIAHDASTPGAAASGGSGRLSRFNPDGAPYLVPSSNEHAPMHAIGTDRNKKRRTGFPRAFAISAHHPSIPRAFGSTCVLPMISAC